jgi:hypothetical protein
LGEACSVAAGHTFLLSSELVCARTKNSMTRKLKTTRLFLAELMAVAAAHIG